MFTTMYVGAHGINNVMGNFQGSALCMKVTNNNLRMPILKNW
jgi:hypothetical protein